MRASTIWSRDIYDVSVSLSRDEGAVVDGMTYEPWETVIYDIEALDAYVRFDK